MEPFLEALLLAGYPTATRILATQPYRPGYRDYPARVQVQTLTGSTRPCVVKTSDHPDRLEAEAQVLIALAECGLPVPAVLAGPLPLPVPLALADDTVAHALLVLSELPGQPLPWLGTTSLAEADLTCRLLIQAVLRLHQLTEPMSRQRIAAALPHVTLSDELAQIEHSGSDWLEVDLYSRAIDRLRALLSRVELPLVFSNGDYNPLNFLQEGERLSGWIDFAGARFEDPHIGFAKFQIWSSDEYGWGTGMKAGLIERYLYQQNVSRRQFAPRLVLRCLQHLQREVPINGEAETRQRAFMLSILGEALSALPS
jgi:aminoglycoside phosphotransferase